MKYTLRPYQEKAVNAGIGFFTGPRRFPALMVLPTGSGKSLIIASIVKQIEGHTLIFQPSKEILEQNVDKIISYDPFLDVSVFSASMNQKKISKITYATIGSAINKKESFEHFDNVIIDETHLLNASDGMYKRFLSHIGNKKVLGLTATPYRMHTNSFGTELRFITRTRPRVYHNLIYYCQIGDLMNEGYLSRMKYYSLDDRFDVNQLVVTSTKLDYTDESVKRYYHEIDFSHQIADVVLRLLKAGRKSILVFTKFVDESKDLKDVLGDRCEMVSADTPKADRERILADFKSGKVKVVTNVGVLTTGFDFPELSTILLARPTRSLALYYQMVGRAMRPHASKPEAWVVDMCGTFKLFGKVEHLHLCTDGAGKWYYRNNVRRLTNVYL